MKRRRMFAVILGCILLCSACSSGQREIYDQTMGKLEQMEQAEQATEAETGSLESEEVSGEITFRVPFVYSEKILAEEFMALHPGVTITFLEHEMQDASDLMEFADILAVEMMSGNAADICDLSMVDYVGLSRNGLVRDLNEYMDADPDFRIEDYFTNVLEAVEVDGKLYGLPFGFKAMLVWLNKPMIEVLGVDLSQYDGISIPQVMDLYEEAERRDLLPENYVLEDTYPISIDGKEYGAYFDAKSGEVDFDNPDYIRFLERLMEKVEEPEGGWREVMHYSDSQYPKMKNSFMFSGWTLDASHILWYEQSSAEWTEPIPLERSDGTREFYSALYGISSDSDNADLAWEFLKYCISEKNPENYGSGNQDVWYKDLFAGIIPINRYNIRHMAEYMYAGIGVDEEVYDKFVEIAERVDSMNFISTDLTDVWDSLENDFFYNGLLTAEEYARQMQERTELYFQE